MRAVINTTPPGTHMISPPISWSVSAETPQMRGASAYQAYHTELEKVMKAPKIAEMVGIRNRYAIWPMYGARGNSGSGLNMGHHIRIAAAIKVMCSTMWISLSRRARSYKSGVCHSTKIALKIKNAATDRVIKEATFFTIRFFRRGRSNQGGTPASAKGGMTNISRRCCTIWKLKR